jgi:hypothetical protein
MDIEQLKERADAEGIAALAISDWDRYTQELLVTFGKLIKPTSGKPCSECYKPTACEITQLNADFIRPFVCLHPSCEHYKVHIDSMWTRALSRVGPMLKLMSEPLPEDPRKYGA